MNTTATTGALTGKNLVGLVWRHAPSKYKGTELVTLLKIAGLTKNVNGEIYAWPSTATLARACGVERRYTQRVLRRLKADGLLKIRSRKGHSNHIAINVEALRALPLADPGEPSELAINLANVLHKTIVSEIQNATPDTNWEDSWPGAIQALFDRGHSRDTVAVVARQALNDSDFRQALATHGAVALLEQFQAVQAKHGGAK